MKKSEMELYKPCSLEEIQNVMLKIMIDIDILCKKYGIDYWLSDGSLLGAIRHNGFIPWDDDMDICMTYDSYLKFIKVAEKELSNKYFIQNYNTDEEYDIVGVHTKIRDKNSIFIEEWDKNYFQGAFIDIFIMNQFHSNSIKYKIKKEFYRLIALSLVPISEFDTRFKRIIKRLLRIIFIRFNNRKFIEKADKANQTHNQEGDMFSYNFSTPMGIEYKYQKEDIFPLQRHKFAGYEFLIPNNYDKILKVTYGDYMHLPKEKDRHGHALFYSIERRKSQ